MLSTADQLAHSITGKETLENCTTAELEQLVSRYPFFPISRLLLAGKNGQINPAEQNLSLYFTNPFWLDYLLNKNGEAEIIELKKETGIPVTTVVMAETIPYVQEESAEVNVVQALQTDITPEPFQPVLTNDPEPASMHNQDMEDAQETGDPDNVQNTGNPDLVIPAIKIEAIDPDKQTLIFEPYHTVDYFASQGIKMNEQEKPADQLGIQLKRFTDWLKVMKKLPVTELQQTSDPKAEQKVEQLAQHSLQEKEVLTESMAEVWEKQGNKERAAAIYNKLSLLDPAKSAYFAAKIEDLKK